MKREIALTMLLLAIPHPTHECSRLRPNHHRHNGYPSASNGDLGVTAGSYWIGQFPVQITNATGTYPIEVYCLNYTGTVNEGSPYTASIDPANDTAQWRAISYILSWNNPTDGTTQQSTKMQSGESLATTSSKTSL